MVWRGHSCETVWELSVRYWWLCDIIKGWFLLARWEVEQANEVKDGLLISRKFTDRVETQIFIGTPWKPVEKFPQCNLIVPWATAAATSSISFNDLFLCYFFTWNIGNSLKMRSSHDLFLSNQVRSTLNTDRFRGKKETGWVSNLRHTADELIRIPRARTQHHHRI